MDLSSHRGPASGLPVSLTINGSRHDVTVDPWVTLLDLLRGPLSLTGTKKGCDHGQCGACTVLIDGERINSCLKLAVSLEGAEITTIEGLGTPDNMHPLQKAFVEHDAYQCGYCTPGQICSAAGLITEGHAHSREEIRELMSGNLCRCGAYTNIADAIEDVMAKEEHGRSRSGLQRHLSPSGLPAISPTRGEKRVATAHADEGKSLPLVGRGWGGEISSTNTSENQEAAE